MPQSTLLDWMKMQFESILQNINTEHPEIFSDNPAILEPEYNTSSFNEFSQRVRKTVDDLIKTCKSQGKTASKLLNISSSITPGVIQQGCTTFLHLAAALKDFQTVKLLVDEGSEVTKETYYGKTYTVLELAVGIHQTPELRTTLVYS